MLNPELGPLKFDEGIDRPKQIVGKSSILRRSEFRMEIGEFA
mgnify:CR=1 FL=1